MTTCPDVAELKELLADGSGATDGLRNHVGGCAHCQALLDTLTDDPAALAVLPTRVSRPSALDPALAALVERLRQAPPEAEAPPDAGELRFPGPPGPGAPLGRLGAYDILEPLGSGASGFVFKVRDRNLNRTAALKVLRPDLASLGSARARFLREARAAASLRHDHVVGVYEIGSPPDFPPYLVLELVAGESLADRLRREGALPPRDAAQVVRQAAQGIAAAHAEGLVHRDIKPSNVLLQIADYRLQIQKPAPVGQSAICNLQSAIAKIADFGLARPVERDATLTTDGQVLGTPAYMSPEQAAGRGADVDARSDVYSLGAVLYHGVTGRLPFQGSERQILTQVVHEEPLPPRKLNARVPRDLETICLKCLEKEPARRYASAADLAEDLRRFLDHEPIHARAIGRAERLRRWCRRNPRLAGVSAVAALLLVVAMAAGTLAVINHVRHARAEEVAGLRDTLARYLQLGDQRLAAGDADRAAEYFRLAWGTAQDIEQARPGTPELRRDLYHVYLRLGDAALAAGDTDQGGPHYEQALAIARELAAAGPDDVEGRRLLAGAYDHLGELELSRGSMAKGLELLGQSAALHEAWLRNDPSNSSAMKSLAQAYENLADACTRADDPARAAEWYARCDALIVSWVKDIIRSDDARRLLVQRVRTLTRRGDHALARATTERLRTLQPWRATAAYDVACCYALCAGAVDLDHDDPAAMAAASALRKQYVGESLKLLAEAVSLGYDDADQMRRDQDLIAIRRHPEYKRLVDKMRARRGKA